MKLLEHAQSQEGTKEKLLKLIRQQPACVLALQLDVTKHVSDEDIMAALAGSSENLDIDMRERKVPLEIIERILALRSEARAEAAAESEMRRHSIWILLIRLLLCAATIIVLVAIIWFFTTFAYVQALCALHDFSNGTCHHENTCRFRVAVQLPGEEFAIFHEAWLLPAEDKWGQGIFDENGPFQCCNAPSRWVTGEMPTVLGAGTPCCDFLDVNRSLFCDNFGARHVPCPRSPWRCGARTERGPEGEHRVRELRVWRSPPLLELLAAAATCLALAGLLRTMPRALEKLVRRFERWSSGRSPPSRARRGRKVLKQSRSLSEVKTEPHRIQLQPKDQAHRPTVVQVAPRVQLKEAPRVQPEEVLRPFLTPRAERPPRAMGRAAPMSQTQEQWLRTSTQLRQLGTQELMPRAPKGLQRAPMQTRI